MIKITKVWDIQKEQDFYDEAISRVHTSILRDTNLKRNQWIKIVNLDNKKTIFRKVRGASPKDSSKEYMELDYDSRLELGIVANKNDSGYLDVNLRIEQANYIDIFCANWNYPNYAIKISVRISIISLMLGLIGLILGLIK